MGLKLRAKLDDAAQKWAAGRQRFKRVVDEESDGIPNPDGPTWIKLAEREYRAAFEKYQWALDRFTRLLNGEIK